MGRKIETWITKKSISASIHPTMADLHWAAGFLEGEGTFINSGNIQIHASQTHEHEPIYKLQKLFGGTIIIKKAIRNIKSQLRWSACGVRARGVALTLYSLLSPRRKNQIVKMLREES